MDTSRRQFVGLSAAGVLGVMTGCGETPDGDGDCEATPADIEGPYDREGIPVRNDLDLYGYDEGAELRYYGQTATDDQGRYTLGTLVPGWYLNGSRYRPAHIHVKIWVGQDERLTTQLYFDGDRFNSGDPWFNSATALAPDADGNASFDFAV